MILVTLSFWALSKSIAKNCNFILRGTVPNTVPLKFCTIGAVFPAVEING